LNRQQFKDRVELGRVEREEQPLADADQCREKDDRECRTHINSKVRPHLTSDSRCFLSLAYQLVTSSSDGSLRAGFGSLPSFLSGLSARTSSSSWIVMRVLRRGR